MAQANTAQALMINWLNYLGQIAQRLNGVFGNLTTSSIAAESQGWAAIIAALPTCIQNADGSLGAADGEPSTASGHVLDTRVLMGLNWALPPSVFLAILTNFEDFQTAAATPNSLEANIVAACGPFVTPGN